MFGCESSAVPFKHIKTDADMQEFLRECGHFHDGVIKELHLLNTGYVGSDFSMSCNLRYYIRLLVQTQWQHAPAMEILFGNVTEMNITNDPNTMDTIYEASGKVAINQVSGVVSITLNLDKNRFVCGALAYRLRQDCMGPESRFGEEIVLYPNNDVERIDDEWAICRKCNETWKHDGRAVLLCPTCRHLIKDL